MPPSPKPIPIAEMQSIAQSRRRQSFQQERRSVQGLGGFESPSGSLSQRRRPSVPYPVLKRRDTLVGNSPACRKATVIVMSPEVIWLAPTTPRSRLQRNVVLSPKGPIQSACSGGPITVCLTGRPLFSTASFTKQPTSAWVAGSIKFVFETVNGTEKGLSGSKASPTSMEKRGHSAALKLAMTATDRTVSHGPEARTRRHHGERGGCGAAAASRTAALLSRRINRRPTCFAVMGLGTHSVTDRAAPCGVNSPGNRRFGPGSLKEGTRQRVVRPPGGVRLVRPFKAAATSR